MYDALNVMKSRKCFCSANLGAAPKKESIGFIAPAPAQPILASKLDSARQKYVPNKKGGSLQKSLVVFR